MLPSVGHAAMKVGKARGYSEYELRDMTMEEIFVSDETILDAVAGDE